MAFSFFSLSPRKDSPHYEHDAPRRHPPTFSLTDIAELRSRAFGAIRSMSASIAMTASHIEALDIAIQTHLSVRDISDAQGLVDAARRLAGLLNGEGRE